MSIQRKVEIMQLFSHLWVALPTFFCADAVHQLDVESFTLHLKSLLASGVKGIVIAGTTGEGLALNVEERDILIRTAVECCKDTVLSSGKDSLGRSAQPSGDLSPHVMVGISAVTLDEALAYIRQAQKLKADAVLITPPPYVRLDPLSLRTFFQTLHDASDIPIVLYDHPARTGIALPLDVVHFLSGLSRVVGLKDASGDPERPAALRAALAGDARASLHLWSGNDTQFPGFIAQGGQGVISVIANLFPRLCLSIVKDLTSGDLPSAQETFADLYPVADLLGRWPNPAGLKYVLAQGRGPAAHVPASVSGMRFPITPFPELLSQALMSALRTPLAREKNQVII